MKKKVKIRIFLIAFLCIIMLTAAVFIGHFALEGYKMYREATEELSVTELYAEVSERSGFTAYSELPQFYINAVVSTEDRDFFKHCGIDISAILRAVIHDIKVGAFEQGGSTITQQVAKNYYFTQEKRLERKFAEVFMAFDMENNLEKTQIFELYANNIYFGSGYYCISDAADGYFGKNPSQLTEYESAMLAGIPNAPSVYSPKVNPQLAEERLMQVIDAMISCGKTDEKTKREISRVNYGVTYSAA